MADSEIHDLICSHDELRGVLRIAGKHIGKVSFGRRNDPARAEFYRDIKGAKPPDLVIPE